jgi:uncharacterized protein (DUF2252 family)
VTGPGTRRRTTRSASASRLGGTRTAPPPAIGRLAKGRFAQGALGAGALAAGLVGALVAAGAGAGCEAAEDRTDVVVSTLVRADLPLLRGRPDLVAGKYYAMGRRPYAFYRGTFPLFLRDVRDPRLSIGPSAFAVDGPLPLGLGDAHVENFGTLLASDGTLGLEPNDFDGADRWPYHWDLRRLITGVVVGAREASARNAAAAEAWRAEETRVAGAVASAYAAEIAALGGGAPRARVTEGGGVPALDDLFRRASRDLRARAELAELTTLDTVSGRRRLRRGAIADDEPEEILADLPRFALDALPATLEAYRRSLAAPPPAEELGVLDAARQLGSGVASWPRVRVLVLVRGPSDAPEDDMILEMKELADSTARAWFPPGILARGVGERVLRAARLAFTRPDAEPLWGASQWLGFPVQIRREAEAHKTVRVERWTGALGTPAAIEAVGAALARALARVHAAFVDGERPAAAIAAAIGRDPAAFAEEQARVCTEYADTVFDDYARWRRALRERGPRLGLPPDAVDAPSPELRAIYGTPVPPLPLEGEP